MGGNDPATREHYVGGVLSCLYPFAIEGVVLQRLKGAPDELVQHAGGELRPGVVGVQRLTDAHRFALLVRVNVVRDGVTQPWAAKNERAPVFGGLLEDDLHALDGTQPVSGLGQLVGALADAARPAVRDHQLVVNGGEVAAETHVPAADFHPHAQRL